MKLRRTTEDYLKTIYLLSQKTEVHGAHIAEELGVSQMYVSRKEKKILAKMRETIRKSGAV